MAKFENDLFFFVLFCDGREKIVEDNSLEFGDIFMFQYDGDNLFDVKLLGLSGCDKEGSQHFNMRVENENGADGEAQVEQVAHVQAWLSGQEILTLSPKAGHIGRMIFISPRRQ
ncbi:unnamed protein product [Fraxinus pennsylvanica]|uniref:Uncharacterized protein n=1 Tax=Fraxinus pennsylvanica TaxID=56036 RepID=A0AAD1ZTA5_9LAMI|nr:unnamed protein product [Fraxinus pennsylvanica]